jgi:crotonyl-CoA reductase
MNGGGIPVCVVSSAEKEKLCRVMGAELVINRSRMGFDFWRDGDVPNREDWRRLRNHIRDLTGGHDPDIVFEHPGRETFAASVYVAARGGKIVTCASTSGYDHYFDNRYLWMNLKKIVGSHFANYREAWRANQLVMRGRVHPALWKTYTLEQSSQGVREVQLNQHQGKVGVLCLAPKEGLGVSDYVLREQLAERLALFRCTK